MSSSADDPQEIEEQGTPGSEEKADAPPAGLNAEEEVAPDELPPEPPDAALSLPTTAATEPPPAAVSPASAEPPEVTIIEVRDLDWEAVHRDVAEPIAGERAERIIERMEERLASGGPLGLAFDEHRAGPEDQAIHIAGDDDPGEVWFIGDLHGDLLALEAALQQIERSGNPAEARIVFLGDLFDDGAHAAEVVLRVFELLLDGPMRLTVLAGNHDEALTYREGAFHSTVLPSDFTEWLNEHLDDPWITRLGKVIIAFFARAPRALFFPDGLLATHGGIPHTDLHPALEESGEWNDPRVLQDFVWTRAHPRARKRIPNRTTRGSEFGREDFEAFCDLATRLGRPVERMVRGHDHVEERFALFPAYVRNPVLTINALSHRLPREVFGPYERVPTIARWIPGELPEVHRLHIPSELIQEVYPEAAEASAAGEPA